MLNCIHPEKICSVLKCRNTKLRMNIAHLIHHSKTPLSVANIKEQLEKENLKVNKTSIYRELDFLIKNNIINEVQLDSNYKSYQYNSLNQKSYFICTKCSNIIPIEINRNLIDKEIETQSQKNKFIINRHSLVFFGHCHKCQ